MLPAFPFSAIVGQDALKRALLLGAIQPALGGVLVRGTKGVAKSTAVRALASLLPPLETVAGCPFQRRPGEVIPDWPLPADAAVVSRPVPVVELPLGATEDRVLGSLHLEKALRGQRAFEPGLLAAANRGLLYVDEVNLLPDHLVDVLLDAASSGVHRVEREGLSLTHPARFLLVGTMNPEEGDLRPQLLDRFGLAVDVTDLTDAGERAEAVRRRLAHEASPEAFAAVWKEAETAEGQRIAGAQNLLPGVRIGEALVRAVSERCLAAGVEGLRADLTVCRAASAWAAYHGRAEVEVSDVDAVIELALAHRRTRPPEPPKNGSGNGDGKAPAASGARQPPVTENPRGADVPRSPKDLLFESAGLFAARVQPPQCLSASMLPGRRRRGSTPPGPRAGSPRSTGSASIAWAATLRRAAPHQGERGAMAGAPLLLQPADLRVWPRQGPAGCLLLFLVDASGSMAAWRRMRQTKAAILALLVQAYRQRDRIALMTFRGEGARLVLPPTGRLELARQALEELPVGGATPLAGGLAAARRFVRLQQRRSLAQPIWTVLLTDGRANRAVSGADPWQEALAEARALATFDMACLVVDTETGWPRFGRAGVLANALGAACLSLEHVLGRPLMTHKASGVA